MKLNVLSLLTAFTLFFAGLFAKAEDVIVSKTAQEQAASTSSPAPVTNPMTKKSAPKKKKKHDIWSFELGAGYPLSSALQAPSKQLEISSDMFLSGRWKWGPYLGLLLTDEKDSVYFPATGYTETRKSLLTSYTGGLQGRYKWKQGWDFRGALGVSYTQQKVNSVDTNAPIPSTAVGYSKDYPLGVDGKVAIQYSVNKKNWAYGAELGYENTALNSSSQAISIIYLNFLLRTAF